MYNEPLTAQIVDCGTLDTVINIYDEGELIDTVRVDSEYRLSFEDDIDFIDNILDLYEIQEGF